MKLRVLCPQEYTGADMNVTPCTRCDVGWRDDLGRCSVEMGVEHFEDSAEVPECPMAHRCQHQIQVSPVPCLIRQKGLICESALVWAGMSKYDAMDHPLSFNAIWLP